MVGGGRETSPANLVLSRPCALAPGFGCNRRPKRFPALRMGSSRYSSRSSRIRRPYRSGKWRRHSGLPSGKAVRWCGHLKCVAARRRLSFVASANFHRRRAHISFHARLSSGHGARRWRLPVDSLSSDLHPYSRARSRISPLTGRRGACHPVSGRSGLLCRYHGGRPSNASCCRADSLSNPSSSFRWVFCAGLSARSHIDAATAATSSR